MAKKASLGEKNKKIEIPFDLYTGFSLVVEELKNKGFEYSKITIDSVSPILTFESKELKERILININEEDLLIRQFSVKKNSRKLKVIYVTKPAERNFKLI